MSEKMRIPKPGENVVYITGGGKRFWAEVTGYHAEHTEEKPLLQMEITVYHATQTRKKVPPTEDVACQGYFVPQGPKTYYELTHPAHPKASISPAPVINLTAQSNTVVEAIPHSASWTLGLNVFNALNWYREKQEVKVAILKEPPQPWKSIPQAPPLPTHVPPPPKGTPPLIWDPKRSPPQL